MTYSSGMLEIIQSETFRLWRTGLKDRQAIFRINARLDRVLGGNFGDVKPVGGGVAELRIDYGPGYRMYFIRSGALVVVLLAGGDKRTQEADIKRAMAIAKEWRESES